MTVKKYYLFLDDVRFPEEIHWVVMPHKHWTVVRSYDGFVQIVESKGLPGHICYDHDLSVEHYIYSYELFKNKSSNIDYSKFQSKTGFDCAKFVCDICESKKIKHPDYSVHSRNPIGKENIINYIESYNKNIK